MVNIVEHRTYKTLTVGAIPETFWSGFPTVRERSVFIKPNLVSPLSPWDFPSTTRVEVVELVVQKLLQANPRRIVIGECGFKDQWELTMLTTGYRRMAQKYGIEIIPLQDGANFHKFTLRRLEKYRSLYGVKFSDYMLECDVVINIPKMKVHCMAGITGAIKNMMGTMAQKGSMHPRASVPILHERLADLYQLTSQIVKFVVMDGIVGAEYAEQCGHPVRSKVLISGTNQWEVDVAAAKLMGVDPMGIGYLRNIGINFDSVQVPKHLVKQYEMPLKYR
jgi:uncharacterized protein (DUF362 family)